MKSRKKKEKNIVSYIYQILIVMSMSVRSLRRSESSCQGSILSNFSPFIYKLLNKLDFVYLFSIGENGFFLGLLDLAN